MGLRATEECREFPDLTLQKHLSEIYNFWDLQEYFDSLTEAINQRLLDGEKNLLISISFEMFPFVDNPSLNFHDLYKVMRPYNRREVEQLAYKLYEIEREMKKVGTFPENFESIGVTFVGEPVCI